MKRRVTLKQIAAEAGVHFSTVSLALRNDPRLPAETREKLRGLAERLGYVPDAAMSALCAYRNARRPAAIQSGLAYLTDMPGADSFAAAVFRHAKEQAARLGYHLMEFNLRTPGATLERFKTIWWNTGLKGVLIGPFIDPCTELPGDWSRWPVVAYGHSVPEPQFNRAVLNHFQNLLLHLNTLRAKGYRRIGLCLSRPLSERTAGQLHAAYLLDQARHPDDAPAAILADASEDADALDAWVRAERLDAVIAHPRQHELLAARGWSIPERLGFSLLTWKHYEPETGVAFSGFDTKTEVLAANAIHFLVSLIHEQALGLLNPPRYYMISGEFHEGMTTREAEPTAAGEARHTNV